MSFVHSFRKYLLSTCYVLGPGVHQGTKHMKALLAWSSHSGRRKQTRTWAAVRMWGSTLREQKPWRVLGRGVTRSDVGFRKISLVTVGERPGVRGRQKLGAQWEAAAIVHPERTLDQGSKKESDARCVSKVELKGFLMAGISGGRKRASQ